ncbi:hypothetical protein PVAND_017326 [Polypedilum vanderplanki]|uniref:Uncharacterized protein n=1 Tax=Polypedilum vanderplanki TaxID=319348 RepID=A0A9J6BIQ4_POLVA|nr:hypothetical protein PVAND_017326 [Polypedilum vanderplanki]
MKSNLFNPKVFDILEMFDIEHFFWYSNDPPNKEIIERMIDFILNMKNLSKYSGFCNQEILAVLSLKNLNAIYLEAEPLDEEIIIKFLENTKTLKSFRTNNFTKLKVLSVKIPLIQYHEGISKILKHFNNIEELEVLTTEQDEENLTLDENFFIENHKNTNLRFLQTPIPHNNFQNWMKKVSNDFPNIEYLLPVRAYYLFNEKFEKSFIDSNRHLFHVNLNSITNENELFKDCCYVFGVSTYENSNTMVKVIRNKRKEMVLNIDQYFKFCKLQAMMHTPRKLKSFSITLRKEENQTAVENCVKFLKLIGKDVKFFKISGEFTFYQLQKIIEVLPNLEIIKFKWIELDNLVDENLIQINHKNIKKLIFISKLCTNLSQQAQYFYNFFKVIRFNENSLNYFYFTVPFSLNIPAAVDRKQIDNFLENQKLLTKIEEKWSDELFKNVFVLEAKFDEL